MKVTVWFVLFILLAGINTWLIVDNYPKIEEFKRLKVERDSLLLVADSLRAFDPLFEIKLVNAYEIYNDTGAIDFYDEQLLPE